MIRPENKKWVTNGPNKKQTANSEKNQDIGWGENHPQHKGKMVGCQKKKVGDEWTEQRRGIMSHVVTTF